jgi:hypothetical protein
MFDVRNPIDSEPLCLAERRLEAFDETEITAVTYPFDVVTGATRVLNSGTIYLYGR